MPPLSLLPDLRTPPTLVSSLLPSSSSSPLEGGFRTRGVDCAARWLLLLMGLRTRRFRRLTRSGLLARMRT